MQKITIAGDFVPQDRVQKLLDDHKFEDVLKSVKPVVDESDYSIVNLEAPIIDNPPTPIKKNGPNLYAGTSVIDAIKYMGFNCVTLANNHFYDQGEHGVAATLNKCKEEGLDYLGGGSNLLEASKNLYKEVKGKKFAFINCCEHEYSIATESTGGSNPISPIAQFYAIKEAKDKADYVIVITHGGIEQFQYPTLRMKEWYRFFIDAGADVVVNHHQHCYSGYEVYNGKYIVYGLGNFCFDRPNERGGIWNEGYMLQLCFEDGVIKINTYPYVQCDNNPSVDLMTGDKEILFQKQLKQINDVISSDEDLTRVIDMFMSKTERFYRYHFAPYRSRIGRFLFSKGLLPYGIPKATWSELRDFLFCESHNERFKHFVLKMYKGDLK